MADHLSSGWISAAVFSVTLDIVYPLILAFIAWRRLRVGWQYFAYGMLIFFVFQVITRLPLVQVLQGVFASQLKTSRPFLFGWLFALALTAALFEEVGRYVGYLLFMRREEKTWSKAVMYGLGHGGLESILLIGVLTLLSLANLLIIQSTGLALVPAAQRLAVQHQFAAIAAQPGWLPLLGAWERLWTVPVQVAFSVLVVQVFRRKSLLWLWLAIAAHALVDFTVVVALQLLGPSRISSQVIVEGIVAIFGLGALWIVWRLRDLPTSTTARVAHGAPAVTPETGDPESSPT